MKRRYRAHFVSKVTDADGETDTFLDFAHDCGCITDAEDQELTAECVEIGRMLGTMIKSPDKFLTSWVAGGARLGAIVRRAKPNPMSFPRGGGFSYPAA